jgi:hypothetical protein
LFSYWYTHLESSQGPRKPREAHGPVWFVDVHQSFLSILQYRAALFGMVGWMPAEEGRSLGVGIGLESAMQGHISAAQALNERQS